MAALSILNFSNHIEYLAAVGERYLPRGQRNVSAHAWAKRLGYRSGQSLTMVLTGQRLPGADMVEKLAQDLQLTFEERRYFELLVALERHRRAGKPVHLLVEELTRLNPDFARRQPLDSAAFAYVAEWYMLVIEQLVGTTGFRPDGEWIRGKLRGKVAAHEAEAALATLTRLGLLALNAETGELARTAHGLTAGGGVPNAAIRLHHRQMIGRALEALDEQSTADERETTALTLRFDRGRLAEAKEYLQTMKDLFNERFYADDSADVYQLNIQLFAHTPST